MSEKTITIWNDPRWKILFDVTRIEKVKPWEINLVKIIRALIEELRKLEIIDLNPCGIALYSAATIHRMKTEKLLRLDAPSQPKEKPHLIIPHPIDLPIPPEFMILTIQDLAKSLESILYQKTKIENASQVLQTYTDLSFEDYLVKLEERIERFIDTLKDIFVKHEIIEFKVLIEGVDRIEAIRRFILLLFAAARGVIEILQDEVTGKIMVKWIG
jgi:chromatin segregation and condensation protein Rec8/ScpA/Scc1 (kleisin family)